MTCNHRFLGATCAVLLTIALGASSALAGGLEKAQAAAKKKDWKTAAEQYVLVLEKAPEDRTAALGLTEAAIKANESDLYPLVEDTLLTLREKSAGDWAVVLALGQISQALSGAKDNTLAKNSYDAQATECYGAVLKAQPRNEDAAAGMAEVYFQSARFPQAIETVDAFLAARPTSSAKALFWKGQALYYMAQDTFRAGGSKFPLTSAVKGGFRKAQGAYRGATAGDPSNGEGWMQLAYTSAWLGDRSTALEGYGKALELDAESAMPFKGLKELLKNESGAYEGVLRDVVAKHPKHARALVELGRVRLDAGEFKEAAALLKRYIAATVDKTPGWYLLGKAEAGLGNEARATKAFRTALKGNPENIYAAWELDVRIQRSDEMKRVAQSLDDARALIKRYEDLLALAPKNTSVLNNLAFTLREAYAPHRKQKTWLPILKKCASTYERASEILGEWTAEKEASLSWQQRWAQAQIISDTGLMAQFYPEIRDLDKAIGYYETALEYTDDGYRDAFNNYARILVSQERWDDAYELAQACSESIRTEQGQPDTMTRNAAKALMQKLIKDGKVTD